MTREEIDLREQIAEEIEREQAKHDVDSDLQWGMSRAIGIVRAPIWHSATCPCSKCNNYVIPKEA